VWLATAGAAAGGGAPAARPLAPLAAADFWRLFTAAAAAPRTGTRTAARYCCFAAFWGCLAPRAAVAGVAVPLAALAGVDSTPPEGRLRVLLALAAAALVAGGAVLHTVAQKSPQNQNA